MNARRCCRRLYFLLCLAAAPAQAATHLFIPPIPAPIRSPWFTVTINGRTTPVVHAASSYYLLNFSLDGPATLSVRAPNPHYWDRGVEVQPMRYGIRPRRRGAVITFRIPGPQNGPVKLSISRPGDHFADAQMLFLFASPPEAARITAATPGIRYYAPGVHRENIDARSGDRIYLAPGAVVFGSLNLWQVHDVRVFGRGLILYDGPQIPSDDTGWYHRRNWHCIVMDQASNIEIDGITCITRSRTWQIQMENSHHIGFYNVNVIGGHPRNANQDGMDFIGASDATVRNAFIRASDDDFAIEGNWDGYTDAAIRAPGRPVTNITIQDSVLSTSISNTIRIGWPQKTFTSAHVVLQNLDVLHTGYGACVAPFAFFELWADPEGSGPRSNYRVSDIRLEDAYSLAQIRQPNPSVRNIVFSNIASMDGPLMLPSVLKGDIGGVVLHGVRTLGEVATSNAAVPLRVEDGAAQPAYEPAPVDASFTYSPGFIAPHQPVTFRVAAPAPGWQYQWLFGDGTTASGSTAVHRFPDAAGTLLDNSGRFRVLLRAFKPGSPPHPGAPPLSRDPGDRVGSPDVWSSRSIVVASALPPHIFGELPPSLAPGLTAGQGSAPSQTAPQQWTGFLQIPADGGYTLTLLTSRVATFQIDDLPPAHSPDPQMEVCGSFGDAVQPTQISAAFRAGLHRVRIRLSPGIENEKAGPQGQPIFYWQGPQTPLAPIPTDAFLHATQP